MNIPNIDFLALRIQQLVREHILTSKVAAQAAIEAAFLGIELELARGEKPVPKSRPKQQQPKKRKSKPSGHRTRAEIADLEKRLYDALEETPGESIMVLAGRMNIPTQALRVPLTRLKRSGRIRSVGQRAQTRYYPMLFEVADAKAVQS